MKNIAIVASERANEFAGSLRARLRSAHLYDVSISSALPSASSRKADDLIVLLVWDAALELASRETASGIDVPSLIGLWSEGRLVIARRDDTPLPLGMRDLQSLAPGATAEQVGSAVAVAADGLDGDQVPVMFSRAERDAAKVPAKPRIPVAPIAVPTADAPKARALNLPIIAALIAVAGVGGGAWYYLTAEQRAKQADLIAKLEVAEKASKELTQAQLKQLDALKELERARAADEAVRKSGDPAKLKEAQEAARRAEAEAQKQAELVKQREAAAEKARRDASDAKKKADEQAKAKPTEAKRYAAPMEAQERVAQAKAAPERTAQEQAAAEKAAQEKAAQEKAAMSRAQLRALQEEEEHKAALAKVVEEQKAKLAEQQQKAAAAGAEKAAAKIEVAILEPPEVLLFKKAQGLESSGDMKQALRAYRQAAKAGSGHAAKRLGDYYSKQGTPEYDYQEALSWYTMARAKGIDVGTTGRDGPSPRTESAQPAAKQIAEQRAAVERAAAENAEQERLAQERAATRTAERARAANERAAQEQAAQEKAAQEKAAREKFAQERAAQARAGIPKIEVPMADARKMDAPKAEAPKAEARKAEVSPAGTESETASSTLGGVILGIVGTVASFAIALVFLRRSSTRAAPVPRTASEPTVSAPTAQSPKHVGSDAEATQLFVSYSHRDLQRVEPIVSEIEALGRRVWMDRESITGQAGWAGQIVRAIRASRAVVLMASPNSYASDQVVRELYLAMNNKKPIVPIEIEPADLPDELEYILAPFQRHKLSGKAPREVVSRALAAV